MDDLQDLLQDAITRLLTDYCTREVVFAAEDGSWPADLWNALADAGITQCVDSEAGGGVDLPLGAALRLAQVAAGFAAPVPLGEHFLASGLLRHAGLTLPTGVLTLGHGRSSDALTLQRDDTQEHKPWRLSGTAQRVPYARFASHVLLIARHDGRDMLVAAPVAAATLKHGANLAREARDTLRFAATAVALLTPAPTGIDAACLQALGAALRAAQIAAALGHALDVTVKYAQERVQFGRTISKFQAIQHNLAALASQSAAANAAADIAIDAVSAWADGTTALDLFGIGAAKSRAGEAAGIAAAFAHQVHGAIGFTRDYELNLATRRLWSWRDEFGNEAHWNLLLGRRVAAAGAAGLWPTITSTGRSAAAAAASKEHA